MSYATDTPRVTGQYVRSHCKCGHRLTVKTSWTKENPGKRFIACPIYDKSKKCGVYQIFDEELPSDYYRELLYDLHSKVMKVSNGMLSRDERSMIEKEYEDCVETCSNVTYNVVV
ncbi:zinc finger, GRF-type containing protein [Tanacetum coccineum]